METLADRVKTARKHAKLTQSQLAKAINVRQPTISDLESGKQQGTKHLAAIARVCKVSIGWLEQNAGPMVRPQDDLTDEFAALPEDEKRAALAAARTYRELKSA